MAWERRGAEVLIGIPHAGRENASYEWSLNFRQLQVDRPHLFSFPFGQTIDVARNQLAETALANNVEWLFFLDGDTLCPSDTLLRLLRHNLPIVSGLYPRRYPPYNYAMWRLAPTFEPGRKYAEITGFQPGGLVEADAIGMGCCLINTKVFRMIEKPWFWWTVGRQDDKCPRCGQRLWDPIDEESEDFFFCSKARAAGYKIYVDTTVVCSHDFEGKVEGDRQIKPHTI